jgi:hypothetical protein
MFDINAPGSGPGEAYGIPGATATVAGPVPGVPDPAPVPLERLEAQICELAGHLTAATCRFLVLLGDFDDRRGWASWDMTSCAAWLSWKCQMSSGTAREHVRVARALRDLPVIRGEFAAGRLSYAKVRALTRIATAQTDAGLAEIAGPMTGNQLERFARAHRQVSQADDAAARVRRRLVWRLEEDGSLAGTFRLPPLQGAVLLKALRAAAGDLEYPHDAAADVSAETPAAGQPQVETSTSLADALVAIAEVFLADRVATADNPDVYQVIVHVGTDAIIPSPLPAALPPSTTLPQSGPPSASLSRSASLPPEPDQGADAGPAAAPPAGAPGGVSAETPRPGPQLPGHPADPARCHVEDGAAISARTAQLLACASALSWMLHDHDGTLLDVGRRRRRPTSALRRAARERDKCRCRFPGCESRRIDLHHIQYWSNGGRTKLANLISLCKYHHMLVHERGYLIAAARDGTFAFFRADGTAIPASPALPDTEGTIEGCHDAQITPGTIVPPWYGERLDLDHALYVCLANAANRARQHDPERQDQQDQQDQQEQAGPFRPRPREANPFQWLADHRPVTT